MSNNLQPPTIKIEQSLHGYADGHRLLQSSRKFPSGVTRTMLLMTDMSGPSMISGFESYLTGYPLDDIGTYALGKTWYASEMDRPGCVWTHTLLVETSDIPTLSNLRALIKLFKRPEKDPYTWRSYSSSVYLDVSRQLDASFSQGIIVDGSRSIIPNLLLALYGASPEQPVYIPSEDASAFEELVIRTWNQQWSGLRGAFSFSTGSIANRKTTGRDFDLQVISWKSLNQVTREVRTSVIVKPEDSVALGGDAAWIRIAAADLEVGPIGSFRGFLEDYGVDTTNGRAAFATLAKVFAITRQGSVDYSLSQLVNLIAESFPKPEEAYRLKGSLLGPRNNLSSSLTDAPEADILWQLVTTPFQNSFDHQQMEVRTRAGELLLASRFDARKITIDIVEGQITAFGEEFLSGISDAIDIEDAIEFAKTKPQLLNAFTKHNPQLAAMPALWRLSADEQQELFDVVVSDSSCESESIKKVIAAMLEGGSEVLAQEILSRYNDLAVDGVIDWLDENHHSPAQLGREWVWGLRSRPGTLLNWLTRHENAHEQTVAFLSTLLDPHNSDVIALGAAPWGALKKRPYSAPNHNNHIQSMAFLLALGFNNPPLGAAELVARSFEVVHQAAGDNNLPQSSWRLLKEQARDYSSWWSWDRCKRLRCALVERFIRFQWPKQMFLEAATGKTFERVLDNANEIAGGRDFIRKVAQQLMEREIHGDSHQERKLDRYR
ncbi:MAG TPA: hypothetical protein VMZ30_09960 [Pyrinomonadaceae bacterium]|nr:hypothetical protein [Pyrinomonadaceae bacterium]